MKKLINDTIKTDKENFKLFLQLMIAFAGEIKDPYLTDASQTMCDILFPLDGDDTLLRDFENKSLGQIKFK